MKLYEIGCYESNFLGLCGSIPYRSTRGASESAVNQMPRDKDWSTAQCRVQSNGKPKDKGYFCGAYTYKGNF